MPGKTAPQSCPKCGGKMWDNMPDKATGKRGPKAPDFACKDKDNCGAGVWLKDSEKNALQGAAVASGVPASKRPPLILDSLMRQCIEAAKDHLMGALAISHVDGKAAVDALIVNVATTMFIARAGNRGILKVEKEGLAAARAKAAKAEADRQQREEEARLAAADHRDQEDANFPGSYPQDDDLPF